MSMGRIFAGAVALAALVTVATRVNLNMAEHDRTAPEALWAIMRFFTLWTNTLVGLVMGWIALGRRVPVSFLSCLMMAMILVSGVYYGLLFKPGANTGLDHVVDVMLHTVIPLATAVYWLVFPDKSGLRYGDTPWWQLYPIIYCVYALVRGLADGTYPYGFINPDLNGWMIVGRNIVLLALVFVACGLGLVALGRRLSRDGT